jgi:hypothetical protein
LITDDFLCSADSRILLRLLSWNDRVTVHIPAAIEVIGPSGFKRLYLVREISFESGTKLKAIHEMAFAGCGGLRAFYVSSSVDTLGAGCFAKCIGIATIPEDYL